MITIDNLTVPSSAVAGTVVGTLTALDAGSAVACNFILSERSCGYFAVLSNQVVTVWNGSITAGYYSVRVRGVGTEQSFEETGLFVAGVVDAPPPPAPPPPAPAPPPAPPPTSTWHALAGRQRHIRRHRSNPTAANQFPYDPVRCLDVWGYMGWSWSRWKLL